MVVSTQDGNINAKKVLSMLRFQLRVIENWLLR